DITDRAPTFSATERIMALKSFAGFAWEFCAVLSTARSLPFSGPCASAGLLPDAMLSCIGPTFVTITPPRTQIQTTLPRHLVSTPKTGASASQGRASSAAQRRTLDGPSQPSVTLVNAPKPHAIFIEAW